MKKGLSHASEENQVICMRKNILICDISTSLSHVSEENQLIRMLKNILICDISTEEPI